MKRCVVSLMIFISFLFVLSHSSPASAEGDGNIDHGGGGMGNGSSQNFWNTHDEGVRVTIVRDNDKTPVAAPVDFTNRTPPSNILHFGKISKLQYASGIRLSPNTGVYNYVRPQKELPYIIKSNRGQTSIEEIKSYFTDELVIRYIAQVSRVDYETLINGNYKLLLEPIAYITFQGTKMAMTAHEAALYDQVLSGGLRSKMVSLTHQNLPLSLFLETPDLGFPAWNGSTSSRVSNDQILSSLGLGIVRFKDAPTTPSPVQTQVEYRTNTDVITSVLLSTSKQINPKAPASVTFSIMGSSLIVTNIVIPEGDSQLVWVKWRTPSTPQTVFIQVSSTDGTLSENVIQTAIVDLDQNPLLIPKQQIEILLIGSPLSQLTLVKPLLHGASGLPVGMNTWYGFQTGNGLKVRMAKDTGEIVAIGRIKAGGIIAAQATWPHYLQAKPLLQIPSPLPAQRAN